MKKRVVHIVKATGIHGTERHLLSLLSGLSKKEFEPIIIVLTEPGIPLLEYFDLLNALGIKYFNIVIRYDLDPICFLRIYSLIKKLQPSLVHTHLIHGDMYGIAAAWLAGIDHIVSTKHNDDRFRRKKMILFLNVFFNRKTKRIIAISDWIRRFVNEVEAVPLEKIETIYYGLKQFENINYDQSVREEIGYSPQTMVIGIVARLVEQKGHSFLIEAFSHIYQANRNVRLLIVGDGELMPFLQQLVRKKGLDGVITFAGFRHDRAEVLTAIDIFVHPSLWEGFGLSILEAMAMGKPIIATNVSAIPELLEDGTSGLLVSPKEHGELAGAIEKLLSDRSLRESLGQNAQKRWQHRFSEEKMVTDTADLYSRCLGMIPNEKKGKN